MSKKKIKNLTKRQKKQIEKEVRKRINESFKRNNIILENQLQSTKKQIDDTTPDVGEDLQEHFSKHRNDIFVSVLNETTGEKTYEARNFDEILAECENNKTANDLNKYDHIQKMLDESFEYELNTHFPDKETLSEAKIDWEEREKELAAGGETADYDAEGNPKSMKQKVGDVWEKGKLIFFFKALEQGLKLAVKVSRFITKSIKKIIMLFVKKIIGAWIKAKADASRLWQNFKKEVGEKLAPFVEKIVQPFMSIAMKMTGNDAKKAAYLAPVLLNITVLTMTLALIYAFSAFDVFNSGAGQIVVSVQEGCSGEIAESKNITLTEAAYSCGDLLDGLVEEGQKVTEDTCDAVYDQLKGKIQGEVMEGVYNWKSGGELSIDPTSGPIQAWKTLAAKADSLMQGSGALALDQEDMLTKNFSPAAKATIKEALSNAEEHVKHAGPVAVGEYQAAFSGINIDDVVMNAVGAAEEGGNPAAWDSMRSDVASGLIDGSSVVQTAADTAAETLGDGSLFEDVLAKAFEMPGAMEKMIERYGPFGEQISKIMDTRGFRDTADIIKALEDRVVGSPMTGTEGLKGIDVIEHFAGSKTGDIGDAARRLMADLKSMGDNSVDMGEVPFKEAKETKLNESQLNRFKKLAGLA